MGVFENLPYTNFHELNLGWIIEKMKELLGKTEQIDQAVTDAEAAAAEAEAAAASGRTKDWSSDMVFNSDYASARSNNYIFQQGSIVTGCVSFYAADDFGSVGNKKIIEKLPAPKQNWVYAYGVSESGSVVGFLIKKETDGTGTLRTDAIGNVSSGEIIYVNLGYEAITLEE